MRQAFPLDFRISQEQSNERLNKSAFVATLKGQRLLDALMSASREAEAALQANLEVVGGAGRLIWTQFEREMVEIGDEIYQLGLEKLAERIREVELFEECVQVVRRKNQEKGINLVSQLILKIKKKPPEELEQCRHISHQEG